MSSSNIHQSFCFDVEASLEERIKEGIFRAFDSFIRNNLCTEAQARNSVVHALDVLFNEQIQVGPLSTSDNPFKPSTPPSRFFSLRRKALLEFFQDTVDGGVKMRRPSKDEWQRHKQSSSDDYTHQEFKSGLRAYLDANCNDGLESVVCLGVFLECEHEEPIEGPLIQTFKSLKVLFPKLRQIYSKASLTALAPARGPYSAGVSIDEALEEIVQPSEARGGGAGSSQAATGEEGAVAVMQDKSQRDRGPAALALRLHDGAEEGSTENKENKESRKRSAGDKRKREVGSDGA